MHARERGCAHREGGLFIEYIKVSLSVGRSVSAPAWEPPLFM